MKIHFQDVEHIAFIGRFVIFHKGHSSMIEKKYKETGLPVLILIRDTYYDEVSPQDRAQVINTWMENKKISGLTMIIPDIKGVYYGRGVGYEIEEIELDENIDFISGTRIRDMIRNGDTSWNQYVDESIIEAIKGVVWK